MGTILMGMPKTPVHENHGFVSWKYQIGSTLQPFVMEAVTEASGKKEFSEINLQLGILGMKQPHVRHY